MEHHQIQCKAGTPVVLKHGQADPISYRITFASGTAIEFILAPNRTAKIAPALDETVSIEMFPTDYKLGMLSTADKE